MAKRLLTTLYIIRDICQRPGIPAEELRQSYGLEVRTFRRHIAAARDLGASLYSSRYPKHWGWHCDNAPAIESTGLLSTWIGLHEKPRII